MSSHMAQFMVFLNGLILTFTAFYTLNVFIGQIVQDGLSSVASETKEHFENRFGNLEQSIQAAGSIISFSGKVGSKDIVSDFGNAYTYANLYDQMYWLEAQDDGTYLAHMMITAKKDQKIQDGKLHQFVIKAFEGKNIQKTQILDNYADFKPSADDPNYRPVVVAQQVARPDNKSDLIYGITNINGIISQDFITSRPSIQSLAISSGSGAVLFNYKGPGPDESQGRNVSKKSLSVPLIDKTLDLSISLTLSERQLFLQKIPFLMFLFGLTLTLIGTLYVRNNQKQSLRLAVMNAELGQKNMDLNHEVQEREKLNQALRKAEKENRSIIDSVSDIIFETSTEGEILFLNETWQKITGFSAERSLGRNLFDLLYMQDQAEQRSNFAQLVKGKKQSYRAFTRLRTGEGSFRAVELAVSMLRQDENRELRVVGTITDVEERRRAERALSEAEKKYRAIVENAASGIYQVTPEGHYLSANPALAVILGFSSPEEILRDIRNANTDIYYNGRERERQLRDALRSGSVNVEAQVRRKDGSLIWVHENLRAVKDDDDQLLFFEGSMEDITQRKDTEIALREAKVQSDLANRAKSEFLANMSHELRTPLNAVIGFSDIIRTQAFGAVGRPEYLEYARDINDSGKRLLQVINDILDVSRIEAGERQLNEGVVDLSKIVHSSLEMMAPKIEASKMIITNFVNEDTHKIIGESHAVKQMVTNILSNALKFTTDGGRISINADLDDFGQLHFSITDTGIGLTDDEIEKALSPFGQVNTSFSKSESGTGLGLTLVQSLMSLHGGYFELFSQKGIGTTASLIFPPKRVSQVTPKEQGASVTHKDKVY